MRWASDYRLLQCSLGLCTNRIVEHGYTEVSWHTSGECSKCSVRGLQDPPRRLIYVLLKWDRRYRVNELS